MGALSASEVRLAGDAMQARRNQSTHQLSVVQKNPNKCTARRCLLQSIRLSQFAVDVLWIERVVAVVAVVGMGTQYVQSICCIIGSGPTPPEASQTASRLQEQRSLEKNGKKSRKNCTSA